MEVVWYSFTAIVLFLIGVIGATSNALVVVLMARNRQLWNRQNVLIWTLALADLTMATGGIIFPLISAIHHRWIFGPLVCQIYAFATNFVGIATIAILTLLAVDRAKLVRQNSRRSSVDERGSVSCVTSAWIFAFLVTSPPLFGWGRYTQEGPGISCSIDWEDISWNSLSYIVFLLLSGFVLPVVVICTSYLSIYLTLRRMSRARSDSTGLSRAEFRITLVIASMVIGYLLTWLPYTLLALVKIASAVNDHDLTQIDFKSGVAYLPALLAKSSIIYNPIIYVALNTQFQVAWKQTLNCTQNPVVCPTNQENDV